MLYIGERRGRAPTPCLSSTPLCRAVEHVNNRCQNKTKGKRKKRNTRSAVLTADRPPRLCLSDVQECVCVYPSSPSPLGAYPRHLLYPPLLSSGPLSPPPHLPVPPYSASVYTAALTGKSIMIFFPLFCHHRHFLRSVFNVFS